MYVLIRGPFGIEPIFRIRPQAGQSGPALSQSYALYPTLPSFPTLAECTLIRDLFIFVSLKTSAHLEGLQYVTDLAFFFFLSSPKPGIKDLKIWYRTYLHYGKIPEVSTLFKSGVVPLKKKKTSSLKSAGE